MNSDIRSDDFAARLRRIEEMRRQSAATKTRRPAHKTATGSNGEATGMRNALIWLVLVIVLGTGGYVAWKLNSVELDGAPANLSGV